MLQTDFLTFAINRVSYYRSIGTQAMLQVKDEELFIMPNQESNSIAMIVQHLDGNMRSRWTDFLTTDGEKEWRMRDAEFDYVLTSRAQVEQAWNNGWNCFLNTLHALKPSDLDKRITIRNESLSVIDAILRQVSHYPYHVGQMVYLAKMFANQSWQTLSIAKNKSLDFNQEMRSKSV